jgi:hypothetical protein
VPQWCRPVDPLRYVILRHEGIALPHFDLMFETAPGSLLATWRSDAWPIEEPTPLLRLGDHRREYLTYEGAISGNRGHVRHVESGRMMYELQTEAHVVLKLMAGNVTRGLELQRDKLLGESAWRGSVWQSPTNQI